MSLVFYTNGHISGEIRAKQIGEYLNAKIDPLDVDSGDICVHVKNVNNINDDAKYNYIDVVDNTSLRFLLKKLDVGVIAFTERSQAHLQRILQKEVIYIPQHHCNFEGYVRTEREIKTIGFIGGSLAFCYPLDQMSKILEENGLEFKVLLLKNSKNISRKDVVNFYKDIDIQIYYRTLDKFPAYLYKDSLKFMNAASFKIPTIARVDNTTTKEMQTAKMIVVNSIHEMVKYCIKLRGDKNLYEDLSLSAYELSQSFHISKIAPMYLELKGA